MMVYTFRWLARELDPGKGKRDELAALAKGKLKRLGDGSAGCLGARPVAYFGAQGGTRGRLKR